MTTVHLCVCQSLCLHLSVCVFVQMTVCLCVCPDDCLSVCLSVYLNNCVTVIVTLCVGRRYAGVGDVSQQQQRSFGGECALDTEELIRCCHQTGDVVFVNTIIKLIV